MQARGPENDRRDGSRKRQDLRCRLLHSRIEEKGIVPVRFGSSRRSWHQGLRSISGDDARRYVRRRFRSIDAEYGPNRSAHRRRRRNSEALCFCELILETDGCSYFSVEWFCSSVLNLQQKICAFDSVCGLGFMFLPCRICRVGNTDGRDFILPCIVMQSNYYYFIQIRNSFECFFSNLNICFNP